MNRDVFHTSEKWQMFDETPEHMNRNRMYTPLSYLTVPCELTRDADQIYQFGDRIGGIGDLKFDMSSFAIIEPEMLQLTDEKKLLFNRFLNFFQLEPYIDPASAVSLQAHKNRKDRSAPAKSSRTSDLPGANGIKRLAEGMSSIGV